MSWDSPRKYLRAPTARVDAELKLSSLPSLDSYIFSFCLVFHRVNAATHEHVATPATFNQCTHTLNSLSSRYIYKLDTYAPSRLLVNVHRRSRGFVVVAPCLYIYVYLRKCVAMNASDAPKLIATYSATRPTLQR